MTSRVGGMHNTLPGRNQNMFTFARRSEKLVLTQGWHFRQVAKSKDSFPTGLFEAFPWVGI